MTTTLPVNCQYCGGAMTLQMSDWPSLMTPDAPPNTVQTWDCPYCDRPNRGRMPGRVVWVIRGHGPHELPPVEDGTEGPD